MRRAWVHKLFCSIIAAGFLSVPVVLSFAPRSAVGSELQMLLLPTYSKYRCAVCHTDPAPTVQNATLNKFGQDFLANEHAWDSQLAEMNSDGDRCSNGFELGDRNGDGVADNPSQVVENSNPGDPNDCTVPLDRPTWGLIKDMFRGELRELSEFMESGEWEEFLSYYP